MQNISRKDIISALAIVEAVAQGIKELGAIPSGHLYARLMEKLSYSQFSKIISILENNGLVRNQNGLLYWSGPK